MGVYVRPTSKCIKEPNDAQSFQSMLRTLREFGTFLLALWREGKALVMGGSIFAVIAIWGFVTGKALPLNLGYLALAVTFIWAGFLAWRKEVRESARLRVALDSFHGDESRRLIFVHEGPAFLTKFFKDHTSIQAEKLIQPYVEKWMRLSNVTVHDISERGSGHRIFGLSTDGGLLAMYFQEQWSERILILRRGSKIAIIGQITQVDNGSVRLENCEILDSGPGVPD